MQKSNQAVIKLIEDPETLFEVENLQRQVWPGSETDVVPQHMLRAAVHSGGMVIGAFEPDEADQQQLIGFVYGFPGIYTTPDGPRLKHCSHMMGILPGRRDQGLGFRLKRAQWQMVRKQGVDRITWTFDPLLSRNAHLNIARLGAVCNTYEVAFYGPMRDGLNAGLDSDRFAVDLWVNSRRVERRLSHQARPELKRSDFEAAQAEILNPVTFDPAGLPVPPAKADPLPAYQDKLCLVEIPSNFSAIKVSNFELAKTWRQHIREIFVDLFAREYYVTDFIYEPAEDTRPARSFYVISHGNSTL